MYLLSDYHTLEGPASITTDYFYKVFKKRLAYVYYV